MGGLLVRNGEFAWGGRAGKKIGVFWVRNWGFFGKSLDGGFFGEVGKGRVGKKCVFLVHTIIFRGFLQKCGGGGVGQGGGVVQNGGGWFGTSWGSFLYAPQTGKNNRGQEMAQIRGQSSNRPTPRIQ